MAVMLIYNVGSAIYNVGFANLILMLSVLILIIMSAVGCITFDCGSGKIFTVMSLLITYTFVMKVVRGFVGI